MPTAVPPPSKGTEKKALIVAAVVAVVFLVLFVIFDGGFSEAPDVSEGGEDPITAAPMGTEPPEVEVDQDNQNNNQ